MLCTQRTRSRGFTLLELMVVAVILMLLAGIVTALVTKRVEEAKHAKAVADIETLGNAIDQYHLHNGDFPPDMEALRTKPGDQDLPNWNGPYIKKPVPNDPWNRPYVYVTPGEHNTDSYDLFTLGRDGKEGGSSSDADINNWQ
jgi:general secretion pathway protein G